MDETLARWRDVLADVTDLEVRPPATEAAVAAFEARRGIELPLEYRRFVREVADGILADGEPALYGVVDLEAGLGHDGDVTQPFDYGDGDAAALLAALAALPRGGSVLADEAVMALQHEGQPDGCLTLTFGDGNSFSALVVTGAQRGRMWRTGHVDAPETGPLHTGAALAPLGFLEWLPGWASNMLGLEL